MSPFPCPGLCPDDGQTGVPCNIASPEIYALDWQS